MQEILLSDLVGDPEVLSALLDDETQAEVQLKKELSKYQVPVADHLQFKEIPVDINSFIEQLYPNMKFFIMIRTRDPYIVDGIINNFIMYMLDVNKAGTQRFKMYDPVKYPNQPYYRWFISNLRYFWLTYRQQLLKDQFMVTLSETDYDSTVGSPANNAASLDLISVDQSQEAPDSLFFVSELINWLKSFSAKHSKFNCFEAKAYELFRSRVLGENNNSFAERNNISPSAASQWNLKLKALIRDYMDGNALPA